MTARNQICPECHRYRLGTYHNRRIQGSKSNTWSVTSSESSCTLTTSCPCSCIKRLLVLHLFCLRTNTAFMVEPLHPIWTPQVVLPILAVSISCVIFLRSSLKKRSATPFPPGPTPKPVIGNAFDLAFKKPWLKYCEWAKEYNSSFFSRSSN